MKFLVVEGIDGSGKSTQINLIKKHLEANSVPYRYLHFPRAETGIYGELIARFLRGDLGSIDSVNPYLVALIYAGDRKDAADQVNEWLNQGLLVLLDRYVFSNIAFQCAKINDRKKQEELRNWILDLEYNYNKIPRPDINILLDVPFSFTERKLAEDRSGSGRDYLQGNRDIHEDNLDFQRRVREIYLWQAKTSYDLRIIDCTDKNGGMRPPESIFGDILKETGL